MQAHSLFPSDWVRRQYILHLVRGGKDVWGWQSTEGLLTDAEKHRITEQRRLRERRGTWRWDG